MPTESLTNREWLPGELLSGLERRSPGWFLDMNIGLVFLLQSLGTWPTNTTTQDTTTRDTTTRDTTTRDTPTCDTTTRDTTTRDTTTRDTPTEQYSVTGLV